ncbi:Zinc finger LIM-type [Trinorchestia longiramus]|nr:Zinc finger LIM-type [Trinorchestia longiramus]
MVGRVSIKETSTKLTSIKQASTKETSTKLTSIKQASTKQTSINLTSIKQANTQQQHRTEAVAHLCSFRVPKVIRSTEEGGRQYCGFCGVTEGQWVGDFLGLKYSLYFCNKKMEYKARQWHEKCFCCCVCKTPIGTKSFIPREQEIYCTGCYEEKFATRCIKCNKIITSGGVTYKNEPWHRECFTCTNCSASLAGQRFTSRDDKPYCAECFGDLFAKRCTACTKPITGKIFGREVFSKTATYRVRKLQQQKTSPATGRAALAQFPSPC